jgi:hypothetical protein
MSLLHGAFIGEIVRLSFEAYIPNSVEPIQDVARGANGRTSLALVRLEGRLDNCLTPEMKDVRWPADDMLPTFFVQVLSSGVALFH